MNRFIMTIFSLFSPLLLKSPMNASMPILKKQQLAALPTSQKALTDPLAEKRQEAYETLKRHPQLIRYLQDNRESLGLTGTKPATTQTTVTTPVPQQSSPVVREILTTLKKEQEKSPQRPLFVSVNINNQSLTSDVSAVHKATISPPTEAPKEEFSFALLSSQGLHWASTHKLRCLGFCFLGCWGGVQLYLFLIKKHLSKENSWFRWKNHLTLEELYRVTTNALVKEIVKTKTESGDQRRLSASRTVLNQCLDEIQAELSTLTFYESFLTFLQTVPLQRLLLLNTKIIEEVSHRLQRLLYLKNMILAFLEEAKASPGKKHRSSTSSDTPALVEQ